MEKAKHELQLVGDTKCQNASPSKTAGQGCSPVREPSSEREAFYRLLFDSSNDAIFFHGFDAEGFPTTFVDANDTACRRLGYSREELLHLSPYDIDDPASTVDMLAVMECIRDHEQVVFERVHVAKDGRKIPVEISARLIEINGQPMMLSIARDISARKFDQERLLQANNQLEAVFSNVHALLAYMDADFNFIRVNRAYAEADGREPEFFVGKNHFELYPDAENEAIFRQVVETGESYFAYAKPFEYPDRPELGVTYWDWVLSPVNGAGGKVSGVILNLINVTDRRLAELGREESERNLSALFEATHESVLLLDLDGKVLATNETAAKRLKKSRQELLGKNVFDFFPPSVIEQRRQWLEEVRLSGRLGHFEDKRSGLCLEHSIYPVFNAAGQVARFAIYSVDVTERRQIEASEKLFSNINQRVMQGQGLADLLEFVCAEIVQLFGLKLVWIGEKNRDGSIRVIASAGEAVEYEKILRRIGIRWDDATLQGKGPCGTAIRTGQVQFIKPHEPGFKLWRAAAEDMDMQSISSFPLILRGEIYGAFNFYSQDPEFFDRPGVVERLSGIAGRICVAMEMAMDQQQLRLLGGALETASNAIFITDRMGRIQWINAAFTRLSGYGAEEAIGQTPRLIRSGKEDLEYYQNLWNTILSGETWSSETVERHKDGSLYTVLQTITPISDENGEITHFVSIHEDITARKRTDERIRYMAEYDALTDLPNRVLFYDRLHQAMLGAKRKHGMLALLYLDLDRFKAVNDNLGHHAGDLLLQSVAYRLKGCVRESDTVARLGGDEFSIILQEIGGPEDVIPVAEKIIASLTAQFHLDEHEVSIGTSIGIALYAGGEEAEVEPDQLDKQADSGMYAAKSRGGNTFEFVTG